MMAVTLINKLDNLLTPLMVEIDIYVWWLAPLLRDETFEQKIDFGWVDSGDSQYIADGGIGGGAASLTQNVFALRKAHDVVDGQEIRRDLHLVDKMQLFF